MQLSFTSDITGRESSFDGAAREHSREAAAALETILEPGETPERSMADAQRAVHFGLAPPLPDLAHRSAAPEAPIAQVRACCLSSDCKKSSGQCEQANDEVAYIA